MNYLAHLYFSAPTPLAWSGSLMGDFVKGPISTELPEELSTHLQLHRRIDTFTTRSHSFQRSRRRLDPRFRYARAILVDVFYDHFLASDWADYSSTPLEEFSQNVYRGLRECYDHLPPALQAQLPRMTEYDWLTSYREPAVVLRVLQRLEVRLNHRFPLSEGFSELNLHRVDLKDDFGQFMQELNTELDR